MHTHAELASASLYEDLITIQLVPIAICSRLKDAILDYCNLKVKNCRTETAARVRGRGPASSNRWFGLELCSGDMLLEALVAGVG